MKRTALIGLLLVSTAGCGHNWLPFRPFRGAPCRLGTCAAPAPAPPVANNCEACPSAAGYSNYGGIADGEVFGDQIIGDTGYYGGQVIDGGIIGSTDAFQSRGTTIAPPMGTLPPSSSLPAPRTN